MNKKDNFSVALGLTDYINPIMYLITSITIILNINKIMNMPYNIFYIIGVVLSIIFGFTIPTLKLLVGLGKMKFKLPVNIVFFVNFGIFLSGLVLFKNILNINIILFLTIALFILILLYLIYLKTNKFNNAAILIGAFGYLLIYISLIFKTINLNLIVPLIFYILAIIFYLSLIIIGLKADLKDSRVHWVIELSNILCQSFVAVGTLILFK